MVVNATSNFYHKILILRFFEKILIQSFKRDVKTVFRSEKKCMYVWSIMKVTANSLTLFLITLL